MDMILILFHPLPILMTSLSKVHLNTIVTEQVYVEVTVYSYSGSARFVSGPGQEVFCLRFSWISSVHPAISRVLTSLGQDCLFQNPFHFTVHGSSYNWTLYSRRDMFWDTESTVKYVPNNYPPVSSNSHLKIKLNKCRCYFRVFPIYDICRPVHILVSLYN
jgi:hypothetical protein